MILFFFNFGGTLQITFTKAQNFQKVKDLINRRSDQTFFVRDCIYI